MATLELLIGGFGGQGVILSGQVVGKAAALYDGKHSTMTQAFGPEARGSACAAQIVISDGKILDPYVRRQAVLCALSQEGYDIFAAQMSEGGTLLYDRDLVEIGDRPPNADLLAAVPATRTAEEMGRRMAANIVMLGFLTGCTGIVSSAAMTEAVRTSVPSGTEEFNLAALERGLAFAQEALATQSNA